MKIDGNVVCELCNKPVDRIEMEKDHQFDRNIYTVYCHGEREQCEINTMTLRDAVSIKSAAAFKRTRTIGLMDKL